MTTLHTWPPRAIRGGLTLRSERPSWWLRVREWFGALVWALLGGGTQW